MADQYSVFNPTVDLNPYATQIADIQRRQRMAQLLQQQGMEPIESQVVGNRVVPISPWQVLAKGLQAGMGAYQERQANQAAADIQDRMAQEQRAREAAATSAEAGIMGRMFGEQYTPPAPTPAAPQVDYDHQLGGTPMPEKPSTLQVSPSATFAPRSIEEAGQQTRAADARKAADLQNATLDEITPTAKYQYDPRDAFRMAMTPAGMDAMRNNQMLASMLSQMVKPKEYESGVHFTDKGRGYLVSKTGDIKWLPQDVTARDEFSTMTANKVAELGWDVAKFNNLSADQKQQIGIALSNNDINRARLAYETGVNVPAPTMPAPPAVGTAQPVATKPATVTATRAPAAAAPAQSSKNVPLIESPNITPKDKNSLLIAKPEEQQKTYGVLSTLNRMLTAIDDLKNQPGLNSILGTVASRTPNLTASAGNAQSSYNTLVNQAAVAALNEMRAASKTGGAVGNVTEKEWPILQSQLANLAQTQSPEEFRKNLAYLENLLNASSSRIKNGYESTYGALPQNDALMGSVPKIGANAPPPGAVVRISRGTSGSY